MSLLLYFKFICLPFLYLTLSLFALSQRIKISRKSLLLKDKDQLQEFFHLFVFFNIITFSIFVVIFCWDFCYCFLLEVFAFIFLLGFVVVLRGLGLSFVKNVFFQFHLNCYHVFC